jgi:hypothetical protein
MNRYVLFPFRGGALVLWLTFTLGQELALHAGWMGLPLAIALLSWFFKYCFILLDAIVTGAAEPPVLSVEMINPINEQRPLGQALLIAGGAALSLALGKAVGAAMGWLTAVLLLLLLPASIATLGMTGHLLRAAWPPELLSVIHGVGRDYLVLVGAIAGLALFFMGLGHYGASSWVLIAGGQLSFLLAFSLIGSVLHEHRLELGIEYRTMEEHIAERTAREHASARNRMMDHAYMKFRVGKPLEGWQEIQTWFRSQRAGVPAGRSVVPAGDSFADRSVAEHSVAGRSVAPAGGSFADRSVTDPRDELLLEHRAVLAIAARWDDVRPADRLTNELVELYFARRQTGRALDVVEERLASNPKFKPTHAAHTLRLAELAAAAGKRALRRQLVPDEKA